MINVSKYCNFVDVKEAHINPANIDILTVTRFATGEKEEDGVKTPIYDDNYSRVKMIISGTPLDITLPNKELNDFLSNFNLDRSNNG